MTRVKRDNIVTAPIVAGVVAVFSFFVLYDLAGMKDMGGDLAGIQLGLFISLVMAVVVGAVLFGELLAKALEGK